MTQVECSMMEMMETWIHIWGAWEEQMHMTSLKCSLGEEVWVWAVWGAWGGSPGWGLVPGGLRIFHINSIDLPIFWFL